MFIKGRNVTFYIGFDGSSPWVPEYEQPALISRTTHSERKEYHIQIQLLEHPIHPRPLLICYKKSGRLYLGNEDSYQRSTDIETT